MSLLKVFNRAHGNLVKGDIIERDFRPMKVDNRLRETVKKYAYRFRSSARIAHGHFLTDKERQVKPRKLRKVKLP